MPSGTLPTHDLNVGSHVRSASPGIVRSSVSEQAFSLWPATRWRTSIKRGLPHVYDTPMDCRAPPRAFVALAGTKCEYGLNTFDCWRMSGRHTAPLVELCQSNEEDSLSIARSRSRRWGCRSVRLASRRTDSLDSTCHSRHLFASVTFDFNTSLFEVCSRSAGLVRGASR